MAHKLNSSPDVLLIAGAFRLNAGPAQNSVLEKEAPVV
jgi:hypothetical protein